MHESWDLKWRALWVLMAKIVNFQYLWHLLSCSLSWSCFTIFYDPTRASRRGCSSAACPPKKCWFSSPGDAFTFTVSCQLWNAKSAKFIESKITTFKIIMQTFFRKRINERVNRHTAVRSQKRSRTVHTHVRSMWHTNHIWCARAVNRTGGHVGLVWATSKQWIWKNLKFLPLKQLRLQKLSIFYLHLLFPLVVLFSTLEAPLTITRLRRKPIPPFLVQETLVTRREVSYGQNIARCKATDYVSWEYQLMTWIIKYNLNFREAWTCHG